MSTHRFKDQNYLLYDFEDNIYVHCPQCNGKAIVRKDNPKDFVSERTLSCSKCFYSIKGKALLLSLDLHKNCLQCDGAIDIIIPQVNERKKSINIKCPHCGCHQTFKPTYQLTKKIFDNPEGLPTDDYYGLPLWLSAPFKHHVFWALNYDHLNYLKSYIQAELRQRHQRKRPTMVEKLPHWIKLQKNRDELLKDIDTLAQK